MSTPMRRIRSGCARATSGHAPPRRRRAGFMMTPEWHRARAELLRWLDDPDTRWWRSTTRTWPG
jgi:hypothetical protein